MPVSPRTVPSPSIIRRHLQLRRGLCDRPKLLRPVVSAPGIDRNLPVTYVDLCPIAVGLDHIYPFAPDWRPLMQGRIAGSIKPDIGTCRP